MYSYSSQKINTINNPNIYFGRFSFEIENLDLKNENDFSILEAEFLEMKESPIRVKKETLQPTESSQQSSLEIVEDILEINKTLSGSFQKKTELNAKENVRLSNLFIYRNFWQVKNYLDANLQLQDLLFETFYKLKSYFGNKAQFILEQVPDIYEPNFEQLFIRVISNQDINKCLDILDSFENEWWFERTGYFINSPVITLE